MGSKKEHWSESNALLEMSAEQCGQWPLWLRKITTRAAWSSTPVRGIHRIDMSILFNCILFSFSFISIVRLCVRGCFVQLKSRRCGGGCVCGQTMSVGVVRSRDRKTCLAPERTQIIELSPSLYFPFRWTLSASVHHYHLRSFFCRIDSLIFFHSGRRFLYLQLIIGGTQPPIPCPDAISHP